MMGPMVVSMDFVGIKCADVQKKLGPLIITNTDSSVLNLVLTGFFTDVSKACNFELSVLVYSEQED